MSNRMDTSNSEFDLIPKKESQEKGCTSPKNELNRISITRALGAKFLEIKQSMRFHHQIKLSKPKKRLYLRSKKDKEKIQQKYVNNFLCNYTSMREQMILDDRKKVVDYFDLLRIIFFPCLKIFSKEFASKRTIFSLASKKLSVITDISIIIKKIIEVDALKYLLLDDDQRQIFKFIAKPDINLTTSKFSGYFNTENRTNDTNFFDVYNLKCEDIEKFKETYLRIYERSKKSHDSVDNRLINSLNPLIGQVIENSKNFNIHA